MKEKWTSTKVILSGSSMSRLFRKDQKVPVGRYRTALITPLDFKEFISGSGQNALLDLINTFESDLSSNKISTNLHNDFLGLIDQYLKVGGLPAVVTSHFDGQDYRELRTDILRSQEDDFIRKSSISERYLFKAGLKGIANYLGSSSKNTHIHEKQHLAEKVISVEKAWHLIHEIELHGLSSNSKFYPKRYLYDLGIAQEVREMPFPPLSIATTNNPALRTQLGGLFENMVLLQLFSSQSSDAYVSGWKKNSNEDVEVDFVWRLEDSVIPIECKASLKVSKRSFSALKQYLRLTNTNLAILVSAAPYSVHHEDDLTLVNLPIYLVSGESLKKIRERYSV
jgi:predicted AAA+ superfamily ATPase